MTNKQTMKIISIGELGGYVVWFGEFSCDDVQKMVKIAEKHNMACLGFIEIHDDTFFNEEQAVEIKNEVKILRNYEKLNKNLLDTLFAAAENSIRSSDYIKIERCGGLVI